MRNVESAARGFRKEIGNQYSILATAILQLRTRSKRRHGNVHIKTRRNCATIERFGLGYSGGDGNFKIILSLPSEYHHFSSAWGSTAKDGRTLDNLRTRLMTEESRVQSYVVAVQDQVQSEALFAKQNEKSKKSKSKKFDKKKKKGACFECGETDHWRKDCKNKGKTDAKASTSTSTSNAFTCDAMFSSGESDAWLMDSGATEHMCHRRDWFRDFAEMTTPLNVRIGNGEKIAAVGKGIIDILAYDGENWNKKELHDVLYVPDIAANLFSLGKAQDKGFSFRSDHKQCEFLRDGCVVAVGARESKLYRMIFKVIPGDTSSAHVAAKENSLKMWHERFGHQNVAQLKKILQQCVVAFVDEEFVCEACMYGKQHRFSFESRMEKSKACGDIIHADVCGPMQQPSLSGAKYFLLFKDDFSHFRTVYFLKNKSDVVERFKSFVKQS